MLFNTILNLSLMFSFFIGIDISKEWFYVAIRYKDFPNTIKHIQCTNDKAGFKKFLTFCKQQKITDFNKLFVCLEHTGIYGVPLCEFLNEQSICYTLVPGVVIATQGIVRGKNDKIDSKRIAKFALKNHEDLRIHTLPNEAIRVIKTLLGLRKRVMKSKHSLLVSSKEIAAFETQTVVESILEDSKSWIAEDEERLRMIDEKIDAVLKENSALQQNYDLLLSVPGIGRQNALHMLVFTKNFVSFICPKKFATFSGIAPFQSSSGKSIHSRTRVSQKANKKMKALLTGAVNSSIRTCAEYQQYFQKQLERGKNEYSIKNVIRNKIVSRAFAVIKRGTPYVNTHSFMG